MAWVERLVTRTTQPQDACGVDASWGIDNVCLPSSGLGLRAVIGPDMPVAASANMSASVAAFGRSVKSAGTSAYFSRPTRFAGGASAGFVFTPSSLPASVGIWSIAGAAQSGEPYCIVQQAGATLRMYVGNAFVITTPNVCVVGKPLNITVGLIVTANTEFAAVLCVNGVTYTASATGGFRSQANEYLLSGYIGTALGDLGLYWSASQRLTNERLRDLSLNPWAIFEPETVRVWIDDATEAAPPATTVTTDASASYTVAGSVQADSTAAYAVRSSATADAAASYRISSAVQQDAPAQYAIRAAVTADASASYSLIAASSVTADASASYVVRGAVQQDAAASYAVRAAVFADAVASYALITDGQVTADASGSYQIRGAVQSDASLAYEIAGAVQASASAGYVVQGMASADASAAYGVQGAVVADAVGSYLVDGVVLVLQPSLYAAYVPVPRNQAQVPLAANQAYVPTPTNQAYLP